MSSDCPLCGAHDALTMEGEPGALSVAELEKLKDLLAPLADHFRVGMLLFNKGMGDIGLTDEIRWQVADCLEEAIPGIDLRGFFRRLDTLMICGRDSEVH